MQSTETDQTTRSDIEELISEGQDMIEDHDYDMTGWARQIMTALAAERDRADRAEAALDSAWDQGVQTALNYAIRNEDGITLRLEHLDGTPWVNPYRSEATA